MFADWRWKDNEQFTTNSDLGIYPPPTPEKKKRLNKYREHSAFLEKGEKFILFFPFLSYAKPNGPHINHHQKEVKKHYLQNYVKLSVLQKNFILKFCNLLFYKLYSLNTKAFTSVVCACVESKAFNEKWIDGSWKERRIKKKK